MCRLGPMPIRRSGLGEEGWERKVRAVTEVVSVPIVVWILSILCP